MAIIQYVERELQLGCSVVFSFLLILGAWTLLGHDAAPTIKSIKFPMKLAVL